MIQLPTHTHPSNYLPPSTQLQPLINLHVDLSTNPTRLSLPTYPPTCLHTTYLHKYLPLPISTYSLTHLPTNQLTYLTTFLPTYIHPPPIRHIQLPIFRPTYLPPPTHPPTYLPTYLPTPTHPPTYITTYTHHQFITSSNLSSDLPTYLQPQTHLTTYPHPPTYLSISTHSPTYIPYLSTYIHHPPTYVLPPLTT